MSPWTPLGSGDKYISLKGQLIKTWLMKFGDNRFISKHILHTKSFNIPVSTEVYLSRSRQVRNRRILWVTIYKTPLKCNFPLWVMMHSYWHTMACFHMIFISLISGGDHVVLTFCATFIVFGMDISWVLQTHEIFLRKNNSHDLNRVITHPLVLVIITFFWHLIAAKSETQQMLAATISRLYYGLILFLTMAYFYVIYRYVISKWRSIRSVEINQYDITMATHYDITMCKDFARDAQCAING